jgi:hypothetical protein
MNANSCMFVANDIIEAIIYCLVNHLSPVYGFTDVLLLFTLWLIISIMFMVLLSGIKD